MIYFLLHEAGLFHSRISPALAASWRRRSFGPVVQLAADLFSTINAFSERHRLTADEQPLLARLTTDRAFDRRLWRHLAGEILLYAAAEAPAIQTAAGTLTALVAPDQRETIGRAHAGCQDLEFDGIPYRPGHAGINDVSDVARLAEELAGFSPAGWAADDVSTQDADDAAEELAFAAASLAAMRAMYSQACVHNQVVVCEEL
jgi:hypothetical protein